MACLKRDAITAEDVLASLPISDSAWKVIAIAVGHVLLFSPLCLGEQKLSGHSCLKFAGTSAFPWRMIQTGRITNSKQKFTVQVIKFFLFLFFFGPDSAGGTK